jgi:hypothetical protein
LEQNYIQHNGLWYKQDDGLAKGAPTSAILDETFIQHPEYTIIVNIFSKYHIINYYRYVDDILIIYNKQTNTSINDVFDKFSTIHPRIKFTIKEESDNKINYLDITILKTYNKLSFGIYRKPTTSDLIIYNDPMPSM